MAIFYLDPEGGNDGNDGTTFANRWKTITSGATAARIAPGDIIRIIASPDPTSLGINATWTNKSAVVTLASALNALVDDGENAWTASANVTATKNTTNYRTGTGSSSLAIAAGFTTGLAAYRGLGGSMDYSGYQGLTFWIQANATVAASTLSLRLCSDTVGVTTVDTIAIPAITQANQWVPVYVDLATNLGSAIQSIALYADLDPGTVTVLLDNISTVKAAGADALNLVSLISKNNGTDTWFALREINGTTLRIDASPPLSPTQYANIKGYYGTTESVTTYQRRPMTTGQLGTGASSHIMQDSGSAGSLIVYSGGWDRTAMTTQSGESWFDGLTGVGVGILDNAGRSYWSLDKVHFVRYAIGLQTAVTAAGRQLGDVTANHCGTGISLISSDMTIGTLRAWNNTTNGVNFAILSRSTLTAIEANCNFGPSVGRGLFNTNTREVHIGTLTAHYNGQSAFDSALGAATYRLRIDTINANDNGAFGFVLDVSNGGTRGCEFGTMTCQNNSGPGLFIGQGGWDNIIRSYISSGNTNGGIQYGNGTGDGVYTILKSSIAEATPVYLAAALGTGGNIFQGRFSLHNLNGVAGDHRNYFNGGGYTVFSELGANRHTASGIGWNLTIYNTSDFATSTFPAKCTLAKFAVNANKLVTVRCFMKRSNTALTGLLMCRGGQLNGVGSDVSDSVSAVADTWEELEITFTPTESGVIEIEAHAIAAASHSLYFDDMTILQAA